MPKKWKTIRIFISSTFRDMHAERDHLIRFVFPELKEKCRKHRVHLIDVDLRWGVTEADAQDGKALDICLDEIDTCRPYFLGLLGHLYGSIPPGETHSITAQEIFHGVLHNDIPKQVVDLRRIIEGKFEGKTLTNEQINCLVSCYRWNADKGKYLLREDAASDEMEIIRTVFEKYSAYQRNRSFFFFRSKALTKKLAESNSEDFFETQDKVADLKQEIIDTGLSWFKYDEIEVFGKKVREVLWERIEAELGELSKEEKDWLEEEAEFHELFVADRTRRFVGRQDELDEIHAFCEKESESNVMIITGEPGCGKSALMGRFAEEVPHRHPDWLIISHFVGASPDSTNLRQTLKRLCTYLLRQIDTEDEVPEDIKELKQVFPDWLAKAAEHRRILIVLDAVNQLEKAGNAHNMQWLPQKLHNNVRFVVSTLAGDAHDALMVRRDKPEVIQVTGLDNKEIKNLVHYYLKEIRKDFPNEDDEKAFYDKVKLGNPLYILVALEELRVFGEFYKLADRIKQLPHNVPDLFDQVLKRIEDDFSKPLVRDCMAFIACGRQGMTAEELQTLLSNHVPKLDAMAPADKLPDMIWARLYRAFSSYLFRRSGVIDFFHGQLKEAVGQRYLKKEVDRNITHKTIADYFEKRWQEPYIRSLEELPHQLTKAEDWDGVVRILTDLRFIAAKCSAGMTYELILEYKTDHDALPEAQEERQRELKHQERIAKYIDDLITFSRGEISRLDIIPSVEPWNDKRIKEESERIIKHPTRLDLLEDFSKFIKSEAHGLIKFGSIPGYCFQQGYNYSGSIPVPKQAKSVVCQIPDKVMLLKQPYQPTPYNPYPGILKTIEGHTDSVNSVVIIDNGKKAISASSDSKLRTWDLESGECLKILKEHNFRINTMSATPDGMFAISGSTDHELRVWNLKSFDCLFLLEGHENYISNVDITPDGKRAISGSGDNTIRLWDLRTGELIRILEGHKNGVNSLRIFAGGDKAISSGGDGDNRIYYWDLGTGRIIERFSGHSQAVSSLCVTPDGKMAISGSKDKTLRIWDLNRGKCLNTLEGVDLTLGFVTWTDNIVMTPDGKRALTGGHDRSLRLWNLESGRCVKIFTETDSPITSVDITPDGRKALTGHYDYALRLWDIETGNSEGAIEKLEKRVNSFSTTSNGRMFISGSFDGTLKSWDFNSGKCCKLFIGHKEDITDLCVTPDNRKVISGDRCNDPSLRVWDLESAQCLNLLKGHSGGILQICTTPDGNKIVSGSVDSTLRIWDLKTGHCLKTIKDQIGSINSLIITPDGRNALSGGSDFAIKYDFQGQHYTKGDSAVCLWDIETGQRLKMLYGDSDGNKTIHITPDGKIAVTGNLVRSKIIVFDLKAGEMIHILDDGSNVGKCLGITLDGKIAITDNSSNHLVLWQLENGECIRTLKGHTKEINDLSFTPDGMTVISASEDGTLRVWDIDSGQCQAVCFVKSSVRFISKIHANGFVACISEFNNVLLFKLHHTSIAFPLVTPVRLWIHRCFGKKGHWDNIISTLCQWCGERIKVSDDLIEVIKGIAKDLNLFSDQSPCLYLPFEAWSERRLISSCPVCHHSMRFNPFIVDNGDSEALTNTDDKTFKISTSGKRICSICKLESDGKAMFCKWCKASFTV